MTIFYLLTFIVCGAYAALMIFYLIGWKQTPVHSSVIKQQPSVRISVILPFRSEAKNILNILFCLLQQDYPKDKFEIIAVDDFSVDETSDLIQTANLFNLKLVSLTAKGGKKQAIAEGISRASGELIITTDADCVMEEKWLSAMASFYEAYKPKMIVAPVLFRGEKSLTEIMQLQEMTVLTACAAASAYYTSPLLCSGANLAYEKEAFVSVNGFKATADTASGDDMFLLLKFKDFFPGKIHYLKSKDAAVYTYPEKKSSDALRQRKRWASKSFSYGFSSITGIAVLVFLANFFILLAGILSVINVKFAFALIAALPLKCIADYMLLYSASSFFEKRPHTFVFLIASIFYPLYAVFIGLISPFTNYSWKGRKF